MATTLWDSAGLLKQLKLEMGLQDAHEFDDTTDLYPRLAKAQRSVIRQCASRYCKAFYQAPSALTPIDGKTFSFGVDAQGDAVVPMGWVQIAPRLSAFSGDSFGGWAEGLHFSDEGPIIRIASNRTWTAPLYGRWVEAPPDISTTVQPILFPVEARELIPIRATEDWAGEGNQQPALAQTMRVKWAEKFPEHMLAYKRRYRGGGALLCRALWWRTSPDLTG